MKKGTWLLVIGYWCLVMGCSGGLDRNVCPAFYHWQTHLQVSYENRAYLDSLGVRRLYVKYFDVDWDEASNQAIPLAEVQIDTSYLNKLQIVPTIFITNRTLLNLPAGEIENLAGRIFQKIKDLTTSSFGEPSRTPLSDEIQFDCDWTEQTKEKYFHLLTAFRKLSGTGSSLNLSATIRLHQIKFFEKTGVPPVDKGVLMFYNMGDLDEWPTENSILDLNTAEQYLSAGTSAGYPLPLDMALPLFRWGVLFRDGRLLKLINDLDGKELGDTTRFFKIADNRFEVRKSTYLQGYYLYEGDQLRLEAVTLRQLEDAASLLGKWMKKARRGQELNVVFYHLDQQIPKTYPYERLEQILDIFK